MLSSLLSKAASHAQHSISRNTAFFDPELDAPAASPLIDYSQKDLFLAAVVVPVCVFLLAHLASKLFLLARTSTKAAPGPQQQHTARSKGRSSTGLQHHHHQQQPHPHQYQPQWRQEQRRATYNMDAPSPPQQQQYSYASPATERPFRRTQQSTRRTPSPQSERPFRVTQSHRVYHTPDTAGGAAPSPPHHNHHQPAAASAGATGRSSDRTQSQNTTPHTAEQHRPFRVSSQSRPQLQHQQHHSSSATPRSSNPAAAGGYATAHSPNTTADKPFRFRDDPDDEMTEQLQQQQVPPVSNGVSPGYTTTSPAQMTGLIGVPMLFATSLAGQQQQSPQQQHSLHAYIQQQQQQQQQASYQQQDQQQHQWQQRDGSRQQHKQQHQHQRKTPIWGLPARAGAAAQQDDDSDGDLDELDQDSPAQQQQHAWDSSLLRSCAENARYITSVDGLQLSPEYRSYITHARKRQLTYEQKEKHKLNVYKALRNVDPESFRQLFSRREVLEYDQVPLSRPLAVLEHLLASLITFVLLGLPLWAPAWCPYQTTYAVLWLVQQLAAMSCGCTSLPARALSIYATDGPFSMLPGWLRLLAAVLVDAVVLVVVPGLGLLLGLACRLLTQQRQTCGERLLRLEPVREVVRPMHFSPFSPGGRGAEPGSGITSDEE